MVAGDAVDAPEVLALDIEGLEVVTDAGKGRCLRCTKTFNAGSLVLKEHPFLLLPAQLDNARLMQTVKELDDAKRQLLFSQFEAHMDKVPAATLKYVEENAEVVSFDALFLAQVLMTNGMKIGAEKQGLYLWGSKAVHSCAPCCAFNTAAASADEEADLCIYALRDIAVGELLTLSYFNTADDIFAPTPVRRQLLLNSRKHLVCQCSRCEGSDFMRKFPCWMCSAGCIMPAYESLNQSMIDEWRCTTGNQQSIESDLPISPWTCEACGHTAQSTDDHLKAYLAAETALQVELSDLKEVNVIAGMDRQAFVKRCRAMVDRVKQGVGTRHGFYLSAQLMAFDMIVASTHEERFAKPIFLTCAVNDRLSEARICLDAAEPQLIWQLSTSAGIAMLQALDLLGKVNEKGREEVHALFAKLWSDYGEVLGRAWGRVDPDFRKLSEHASASAPS